MKLSQWAKTNGVCYRTAWNIYKSGKLKTSRLPSGAIIVDNVKQKEEYNVVYARVSSSENKNNLESQAERLIQFCNAKGWIVHKVIKECGSGLNDNRKELNNILNNNKASRIIVEHADRITRFGLNYIKIICKLNHCDLVILNQTKTEQQDLIQDFTSIITSFCARIYGQRRSKRKTEQLINELQNDK
jgi:predicted site-specific integrase-resolvase